MALGVPAGLFYWTAAIVALFGESAFTIRFAFALVGIATVSVAYVAFRVMFTRPIAVIAALLLAVSAWHLHFSRVAFIPIGWPLAEVATLLFFFLGIRRESRLFFGLAGAALAFGIYMYQAYPTFAAAFALVVVWLAVFHYRHDLRRYAQWIGVMLGVALLVGLPMASWAWDNPSMYLARYRTYSVTETQEFDETDNILEQVDLFAARELDYIRSLITRPVPDGVDAAGVFPFIDRVTLGLLIAGGGIALLRLRKPEYAALLILTIVVGLGPAVAEEGAYRRTLGLTPFLAVFAALPLAYVLKEGNKRGLLFSAGAALIVLAVVGSVAGINLTRYFGTYDDHPFVRWVYAAEIAEASKFMDNLPAGTYVYFYSGRWPINYETRRSLAPDVIGEDRSREFGTFDLTPDRSREVAYVFLPPYIEQADEVERLYPDGESFSSQDPDGAFEYRAYVLPRQEGALPPPPPSGEARPTGEPPPVVPPDAPGTAEARDLFRQQDLAAIHQALEAYGEEHGSYPSTGGYVQSFCAFPDLDAGCKLRDLLQPLPRDPLGEHYSYLSDGSDYAIFARRESDAFPACPTHPNHLAGISSLLCLEGP